MKNQLVLNIHDEDSNKHLKVYQKEDWSVIIEYGSEKLFCKSNDATPVAQAVYNAIEHPDGETIEELLSALDQRKPSIQSN